jgi:hypothetical protein
MNRVRINVILLAAFCSVNASCTTNRVQVDDHSYHHNDTPSGNTIINHHYPQTIVQPQPTPQPSIQQLDRDFLQYQQSTSSVSEVPTSYYTHQRSYPPVTPYGPVYTKTRPFTHIYQAPTYTNYAQAYRVRAKVQFGL